MKSDLCPSAESYQECLHFKKFTGDKKTSQKVIHTNQVISSKSSKETLVFYMADLIDFYSLKARILTLLKLGKRKFRHACLKRENQSDFITHV